jgi:hypothetical protein
MGGKRKKKQDEPEDSFDFDRSHSAELQQIKQIKTKSTGERLQAKAARKNKDSSIKKQNKAGTKSVRSPKQLKTENLTEFKHPPSKSAKKQTEKPSIGAKKTKFDVTIDENSVLEQPLRNMISPIAPSPIGIRPSAYRSNANAVLPSFGFLSPIHGERVTDVADCEDGDNKEAKMGQSDKYFSGPDENHIEEVEKSDLHDNPLPPKRTLRPRNAKKYGMLAKSCF